MRTLSIAGGALLAVIAAVALIALPGGKSSLAEAAGKLDAQSVRGEMYMKIAGQFEIKGPVVSTARGGRASWKTKAYYPAQDATVGIDVLIVGENSWYRIEDDGFKMPAGKTWVSDPEGSETGGMTMGEVASYLRDADEVEHKGTAKY